MSGTDSRVAAGPEVDEKLYSRQLYVMGHEAQQKMMSSACTIVGSTCGLGMEVAKNCILAGLSQLQLLATPRVSEFDVGANFYISTTTEEDNISAALSKCQTALASLNPYVTVQSQEIANYTATDVLQVLDNTSNNYKPTVLVIAVPMTDPDLIRINDYCRQQGISFIYGTTQSVFGQVFCDFGTSFVISDADGEAAATSQIESVIVDDNNQKLVVKVLEDHGRHNLETNDVVQFARLQGVPLLQEQVDYKVHVTGPFTFEVAFDDAGIPSETTATTSTTAQQGYITQIKQPKTMTFDSFETKLKNPGDFMLSDFAKMDRPPLLHLGFRALSQYMETHDGALPTPGDTQAMTKVYELALALDKDNSIVSSSPSTKRILAHLASGAQAQLSPMCACLGGIVAQEVLKACSGKFTPIAGFLYFDADETLPDDVLPQDQLVRDPSTPARYASQIAVFGKDMQQQLLDLQYFLIGAGAIGCEMLKNWALMGVGCGAKGHVYLTDMDRIEKSNLSRQFLFRNTDINQFKSTTAAKAAQTMNPDLNITSYQEKVAPETEYLFGDDFYDKLSGVCTALDNVEARLYVDQRCLFYRLPMLESGTLGTKGNTQVVVPHVTENYGATRDPPEKSIPVCTLKNFPNQIQHTLQWARDWFEGEFKQGADEVNSYLSSPSLTQYLESLQPNTKLETLRTVQRILKNERPANFEDCVTWARLTFEKLFDNQIRQLLHNFPEDQVTSSGTNFWSGSKRCPKALTFDMDNVDSDTNMKNHLDFVVAAANLRAEMYGIQGRTEEEYFRNVLKDVIVPDFVPAEGVKIAANDEEAKQENNGGGGDAMDTDDAEADDIWNNLPKPETLAGFRLHAIEFDKDIDDHMLFVTACSNLRAMNYSIPTEDTHRSRAIAGRIIPAIATTTALVTGLICLELYKIVGTPRKKLGIDAYKNAFVNLAIPFMTLSEPTVPAKTKAKLKGEDWEWTAWDSLDMNMGDITMGEFMDHFEKEYNLEISMLSYGVSILYSFFANKKKVEERKAMRMTEVITSITKKEFPPNQLFIILEVIANDKETDDEVELPYIKFRFR